jgi:hypothetical protein
MHQGGDSGPCNCKSAPPPPHQAGPQTGWHWQILKKNLGFSLLTPQLDNSGLSLDITKVL